MAVPAESVGTAMERGCVLALAFPEAVRSLEYTVRARSVGTVLKRESGVSYSN
jgi:hypothetical protein